MNHFRKKSGPWRLAGCTSLKKTVFLFLLALSLFNGISCAKKDGAGTEPEARIMYTGAGGKLNTLDPALAADLVSQYLVGAFYDTLLQYDYAARPYRLVPSMLAAMPQGSEDLRHYTFRLRADLYFQDNHCFRDRSRARRRITARDVVFSFLRLADARLHSPGFWLFRDKIRGLDEFRKRTAAAGKGDFSPYDQGCAGLEITDDLSFKMHLLSPEPRLLYALAMPYTGVLSRAAVEYYGDNFAENPAGSGPFQLVEWWRDYRIILDRNPDYRPEFYPLAASPGDRRRRLPLLDRIVCYLVKQPLAGWLLFLQGEMDLNSLDKDNFEAVVNERLELIPALAQRGITMSQVPGFAINYVGFSFTDPLLGENLALRKAISLAYDIGLRIRHSNYRLIPANGPIPPGVPGFDQHYRNPYGAANLDEARRWLAAAGFPGGVNPKTGQALELAFDQGDNSPQHRQLAELMVDDLKKIGIKIKPVLNNKPRFFQKLKEGQVQLFRLSWIGDYPDAENFLQLFYGPNAGSCNRVCYRDPVFDARYREILTMPDTPARTEKYRQMAEYLTGQCPWIFESHPIEYRLVHAWLENYLPHDFAFAQWKYLAVNREKRREQKKAFRPISMSELRKR